MAQPIINNVSENFSIRYDSTCGSHFVYVGLGNQVRRLYFPTKESAGEFIQSISKYSKLKERL